MGCGWLGLPLGESLVRHHYSVKGSTTTHDKINTLKSLGIKPYVISISSKEISSSITDFLKDSHILIINIPPGLRKDPQADFVGQMNLLSQHLEQSEVRKVLFVSSTSVYQETLDIPIITETSILDGTSPAAKQLIAAEELFQNNTHFKTTILRFGGLIGDDRNPATYLSGKKNVPNPEAPINLIHQTDCIEIILSIIKNQHWNTSFNAVSPQHPAKEKYYSRLCKAQQLPLPEFDHTNPSLGKIVTSDKVEQLLNHNFQHKL